VNRCDVVIVDFNAGGLIGQLRRAWIFFRETRGSTNDHPQRRKRWRRRFGLTSALDPCPMRCPLIAAITAKVGSAQLRAA
jgi:hypothetical protein